MATFWEILSKNFADDDIVYVGENLKWLNEKTGNKFARDFNQTPIKMKALKGYLAEKMKQKSHGDLYICFNPVKGERLKKNAQDSFIIGVDIDGVPIPKELEPSYYWETSPDKWQGIYIIDNKLSPAEQEQLLRKLVIKYDFDPSCVDIVHFFRIPNTDNFKYKKPFRVSKMFGSGKVYRKKKIFDELRYVKETVKLSLVSDEVIEVPDGLDYNDVVAKYNIEDMYNHTLGVDRSAWAWAIERTLINKGASKEEVKAILVNAPDEALKFQGENIDKEIHRVFAKVEHTDKESNKASFGSLSVKRPQVITNQEDLEIVSVDEIEEVDKSNAWLIEDIWANHSVGIVGAPSKSFKSTLVLNLACAVATGKPFDGHEVKQGGVLILQGENELSMEKDKIVSITGDSKLPIYFVKSNVNIERIHLFADFIVTHNIKLLIIDPLYMLFGSGDINRHNDITARLKKVTQLRDDTGVSVMIVHHSRKLEKGAKITTSDMYGSAFIEGWYESMLLLQRTDNKTSLMTTYFRNFVSGTRYFVNVDDDMKCSLVKLEEDEWGNEVEDSEKEVKLESLHVSGE